MLPNRLDRLPRHVLSGDLTVFEARTHRARLLGLALLDALPSDAALLITRCRSVHTFGVRFSIDIILLDRYGTVVRLASEVSPQRAVGARGAWAVLETRAGRAERFLEAGVAELFRR